MPPASGRRPPELDDRNLLREWYERAGDTEIARELSVRHGYPVSRMMVRYAREQLRIPSLPPGRRGRPLQVVPPAGQERHGEIVLTGTALAMLERFQQEQAKRAPATDDALAKRIRAYSEAQTNGDQLAAEDALLAIAATAGLIHQHERRLRGAA